MNWPRTAGTPCRGGTLTIGTRVFRPTTHYVRTHMLDPSGLDAIMTVADTARHGPRHQSTSSSLLHDQESAGDRLGLSIVFGIVKQHNGAIKVYSEPGAARSSLSAADRAGTLPSSSSSPPRPEAEQRPS